MAEPAQKVDTKKFVTSDRFGGTGGGSFGWSQGDTPQHAITGWTIRSGSAIDSIAFKVGGVQTTPHGGDGGGEQTVTLDAGEYVVAVVVHCGEEMDNLRFLTSNGRSFEYGGNGGGAAYCSGGRLVDYQGSCGKMVDALQFKFATN